MATNKDRKKISLHEANKFHVIEHNFVLSCLFFNLFLKFLATALLWILNFGPEIELWLKNFVYS